jgi:hypothetical protein
MVFRYGFFLDSSGLNSGGFGFPEEYVVLVSSISASSLGHSIPHVQYVT